MKKALQITPIAGGWAITEIPLGEYVSLSETVAIRERLGESYEYLSNQTVVGFVQEYLSKQETLPVPDPSVNPT